MKLADLKSGDMLTADSGFTCLRAGPHEVQTNEKGELFLKCDCGRHFLSGQEDEVTGELVGLEKSA